MLSMEVFWGFFFYLITVRLKLAYKIHCKQIWVSKQMRKLIEISFTKIRITKITKKYKDKKYKENKYKDYKEIQR